MTARETLIKSTVYGEPAQLCDAGMNKIKVLTPLILPQKFPHLFNQHFLSHKEQKAVRKADGFHGRSTATR